MVLSVQDAFTARLFSQQQALLWLGRKLRARFRVGGTGGIQLAEARAAQRTDKAIIDEAVDCLHRLEPIFDELKHHM